jgi:hypothetical protein
MAEYFFPRGEVSRQSGDIRYLARKRGYVMIKAGDSVNILGSSQLYAHGWYADMSDDQDVERSFVSGADRR